MLQSLPTASWDCICVQPRKREQGALEDICVTLLPSIVLVVVRLC